MHYAAPALLAFAFCWLGAGVSYRASYSAEVHFIRFYYYEFGALVLLRCPCRRLLHAADRRATCSVPVLM
jgi:hypothetical protein